MERKREPFTARAVVMLGVIPVLIWAHEYGPGAGYCKLPKEPGSCAQAGRLAGISYTANGDLPVAGEHIYTTSETFTPAASTGSNLAQGKTATPSGTLRSYPTAGEAAAKDSNQEGNLWQVDLGASAAGSANPTNLSQGRTATQSSTLAGYSTDAASAAVDGNTDGNFLDGSVTHTNADANAWWQVDLGTSATVSNILVWNRTDACCTSRLSDYWVFVSDTPFLSTDTPTTLSGRNGIFAMHQTSAPNPSTNITVNAPGRYVRVQLSGTNNLSLAEVQVFGTSTAPTNLAQGRTATQSSTLPGYPSDAASAAVDGNPNGNFFGGSVTHTNADPNAWWQVDLGASASLLSVVVFNRTDCCSDRLSDYWVFVSDTPFLATDTPATLSGRANTIAMHETSAPSPSTTLQMTTRGRYVRVQLSGTNNLSLAEVQVFGTSTAPTNLAQGRTATQSSTLPGYPSDAASAAVDGNPNGNFFGGSVTHTNADPNAWWEVDLGASAAVSSVVVFNRTDCCSDRLSDYWVFVSDTPFLATDTPTTLSGRANTTAVHQTSAPNPSTTVQMTARARYVRVQLSDTNSLSLAEVQVFGDDGQGKVIYNFDGIGLPGEAEAVAFQLTVPTFVNPPLNGFVYFTCDQFDSNTNCNSSTGIHPVSFSNQTVFGALSAQLTFTATNNVEYDFFFPAGSFGTPGVYSSNANGSPGTLTVTAVPAGGTNLAQGKTATQSSTLPAYPTAGATAAVDGNQDGNFFNGSVTSTNLDPNPWWQVDLGASAAVSSIVIFNRTDCCGTGLRDYWVFVSDTPFLATDTPSTLQNRSGTFASHQTSGPNPSDTIAAAVQGRYVRVQLTNANYLSLAEVQVIGSAPPTRQSASR